MKNAGIICISILLGCVSCEEKTPETIEQEVKTVEPLPLNTKDSITQTIKDSLPPRAGLDQLIDIQLVNPSIQVDLKYATSDNFMKKRLYFDIDKLYLQKDVAERLSKCQEYLKKLHPELSLLVYDGVRPLSVQQAMWDGLDTIPVARRTKFVSNPASGSIHNYGAAVDLTICDASGKPLDMGAGYDDIREIAYPSLESKFLASGELTQEQVENRKLLRKVMASQRFTNIPSEWWHFNACSRKNAKVRYEILK